MRFRFENHELESELRELTRDGVAIPMQPQVFDLLLFLVENRDRVVSKDDLVAKIWDNRPIS
ncbi:winged helix-turn-helix domain-containing protein, partial [Escherichia coli]